MADNNSKLESAKKRLKDVKNQINKDEQQLKEIKKELTELTKKREAIIEEQKETAENIAYLRKAEIEWKKRKEIVYKRLTKGLSYETPYDSKEPYRKEEEQARKQTEKEKKDAEKAEEKRKHSGIFGWLNNKTHGLFNAIDEKTGGKLTGGKIGSVVGKIGTTVARFAPYIVAILAVLHIVKNAIKLVAHMVKEALPRIQQYVTSSARLNGKGDERVEYYRLVERIKALIENIQNWLGDKFVSIVTQLEKAVLFFKEAVDRLPQLIAALIKDLPTVLLNAFIVGINALITNFNVSVIGVVNFTLKQLQVLFNGIISGLNLIGDTLKEFGINAPTINKIDFQIPEVKKLKYLEMENVQGVVDEIVEAVQKDLTGQASLNTVSKLKLEQILTDLASAVKDLGLTTKDAKIFANKVVSQATKLVDAGFYTNLEDASNALKDAIISENYSGLSGMGINEKNMLAMMTRLFPEYDYSGNTVYTESALAGMREEALEKLIGLSSEQLSALTEEGTILSNIQQGLAESLFGKEVISGVNASSGTYDENGNFRLESDDEVQAEIKKTNDYLDQILDKISGKGTSSSSTTINNFTGENKVQKKLGKTLDTVWNEMEKKGKTHSNNYDPGVGWDPNGLDMLHRTGDVGTTSDSTDSNKTSKNKKKGFLSRLFNTDWGATAKNMFNTFKNSSVTEKITSTAKNLAFSMTPVTAVANTYRLWNKYNVQKGEKSGISSAFGSIANAGSSLATQATKAASVSTTNLKSSIDSLNSTQKIMLSYSKAQAKSSARNGVTSSKVALSGNVNVKVTDSRTTASSSFYLSSNKSKSSINSSTKTSTARS